MGTILTNYYFHIRESELLKMSEGLCTYVLKLWILKIRKLEHLHVWKMKCLKLENVNLVNLRIANSKLENLTTFKWGNLDWFNSKVRYLTCIVKENNQPLWFYSDSHWLVARRSLWGGSIPAIEHKESRSVNFAKNTFGQDEIWPQRWGLANMN